jgi:recombination protein RecT
VSNLRDRAAAAAGKDVAERTQGAPSIRDQIQDMQQQFQMAAPRGVEAAQLVRDALTCLRTIKNLDKAEPKSVLGALMTAAQLGLRPGVLGHCWPLPFWDARMEWVDETGRTRKGGHKAQLIIGYQGLVELAHRSGRVADIIARTVYAEDTFDVDYGLADKLVHKPNLFAEDRGAPIAYYAIVRLVNGGHAFYVMGHREMERYRDENASAKTKEGVIVGPWRDNFEGMALKTCVRQLAKWMPKSTELAMAIEVDGAVRVDVSPNIPPTEAAVHIEVGAQPDQTPAEGIVLPRDDDPALSVDPTVEPGFGAR